MVNPAKFSVAALLEKLKARSVLASPRYARSEKFPFLWETLAIPASEVRLHVRGCASRRHAAPSADEYPSRSYHGLYSPYKKVRRSSGPTTDDAIVALAIVPASTAGPSFASREGRRWSASSASAAVGRR